MKYWQALVKFSKTLPKAKLIFCIVILLIIWFILPFLPLNGLYPFASLGIRLALTLGVFLGIALWFGILFVQKYQLQSFSLIKQFALNIWQQLNALVTAGWQYGKEYYFDVHDKIKSDRKHRRLKRLPWYLILGAPQSGKHSLIQQSGLYLQRPEHAGSEALNYIDQFPDFEWWFSQQGVLVDVMSNDVEKDATEWKRFCKLLKRERKHKPFNGVIFTLSLPQLLSQSNKERQDFIQRLAVYIRDIYSHFKAYVPVYLIFNQCDLLEGFMEFFENLSKEEIDQVWGMTLPIADCNDLQYVLSFFNQEYTVLIAQLQKRVMWAFDTEKTLHGRELIHTFPQQIQLFRKPIEILITEIFGATRYQRAVQLRGLYFMSCVQGKGTPQNFLLHALRQKFQLVRPMFQRLQRIGESYFVRGLFFEVILPEASRLGASERRKKMQQFLYRALLLSCPLLLITLGIGMYEGAVANRNNLQAVQKYITQYNNDLIKLRSGNPSLIDTLPALQKLQAASELYTRNAPLSLHLLWASHSIKNTITAAWQRSLHALFLPRIAAQLEADLRQNNKDPNLLYADLKAYLVFSPDTESRADWLKAPLEYRWQKNYAHQSQLQINLTTFLQQLLQTPIEKLSIDEILIARIRHELAQVDPAQRAYGLLSIRAALGNSGDLDVPAEVGNRFFKIFTDPATNGVIPFLYTKQAYKTVFNKQYKAIATEVAEDNRAIGLSNASNTSDDYGTLVIGLQTTYNRYYLQSWNNLLASISVKPFTNPDELIDALTVLTSNDSPLALLLSTVYDNTAGVEADEITVEDHFKKLNNYSTNAGWGSNWHDTIKVLQQLHDYLLTLQATPDPDQADFEAAKSVLQGKAKNPVIQLNDIANSAPEPIKSWLNSIADNCWQIILSGAHNKMNVAWNNQILSLYNNGVRDRFPFNTAADSNVSLDTFNSLFAYNGALEKYFNDYIKPFVNTNGEIWKFYTQQELTIGIPTAYLTIFQHVQQIREEFFLNGASQAQLNFTIKPLLLDKQASGVDLVIGPNTIQYSHGPQNITNITWPLPVSSEDSSITLSTFNSDQYSRLAEGPWSLFKILRYGAIRQKSDDGSYEFSVNFNKHIVRFLITGPSNINVLTLKDLNGFSLPQVIAQAGTHQEKTHRD